MGSRPGRADSGGAGESRNDDPGQPEARPVQAARNAGAGEDQRWRPGRSIGADEVESRSDAVV